MLAKSEIQREALHLPPQERIELVAGVCDEQAEAANTVREYEAAAIARLVGR